ncbi:MAG: DUF58 domain-containing protein [Pirellulaceae bacterium]|nr:DUF58 domain-containing protein [Pirellulaceae bacterium]
MTSQISNDRFASTRRTFIDASSIMQIKNLTMRAKSIVEGFASGLHRSPVHGFSVEFSEYRPYVEGDDPRGIDWKLLARTDRYYVKQYEDETNRRCYIAVDQSQSMDYGSVGYTKAQYAQTIAATFAYYLTLQRDAVGVMTCGSATADFLPPRHRPGHLQQLMRLLALESRGTQSNLGESLSQLAGLSRRRGLVVLISDLLTDPESLAQPLGYLRGRGHELLVIRVLDPSEITLDFKQSTMLVDAETGREMYIDPEAARRDYQSRFRAHEAQLIDICHRRAARVVTITTSEPPESALLELINRRATIASELSSPKHGQSGPIVPSGLNATASGG